MKERILKKDEWLFKDGDEDYNLYKIESGKILTFAIVGPKFTTLGEFVAGNFLGEASFFLNVKKGTYAVVKEDCKVTIFSQEELNKDFPKWLKDIAISVSKKLVENFNIISERGVKRTNVSHIKPLSIEEQGYYLKLLKSAPSS